MSLLIVVKEWRSSSTAIKLLIRRYQAKGCSGTSLLS